MYIQRKHLIFITWTFLLTLLLSIFTVLFLFPQKVLKCSSNSFYVFYRAIPIHFTLVEGPQYIFSPLFFNLFCFSFLIYEIEISVQHISDWVFNNIKIEMKLPKWWLNVWDWRITMCRKLGVASGARRTNEMAGDRCFECKLGFGVIAEFKMTLYFLIS